MRDSLIVCVRVMKSGSQSLRRLLATAFTGRRTFFLPTLVDRDGEISSFQRLRFKRTLARNLFRLYRTTDLDRVFARIADEADLGDLVDGGHIDFPTVSARLERPLKMIFMLRDPAARALSEYNYARASHESRNPLSRFDAGLLPKMASRLTFEGFLDFQLDNAPVYGNVTGRFLGWDGDEDLSTFFPRQVFHAGVLEEADRFAQVLSEKVGRPLCFPHVNRTAEVAANSVNAAERAKIERLYERGIKLHAWLRDNGPF